MFFHIMADGMSWSIAVMKKIHYFFFESGFRINAKSFVLHKMRKDLELMNLQRALL